MIRTCVYIVATARWRGHRDGKDGWITGCEEEEMHAIGQSVSQLGEVGWGGSHTLALPHSAI